MEIANSVHHNSGYHYQRRGQSWSLAARYIDIGNFVRYQIR